MAPRSLLFSFSVHAISPLLLAPPVPAVFIWLWVKGMDTYKPRCNFLFAACLIWA